MNIGQIQIPDFAGTLMRGEQAQASRLQQLAMQQEIARGAAIDAELANGGAAALFGADPAASQSVLSRLVNAGGRQGLGVAMPFLQQQQQRVRPMTAEEAAAAGLRPGTVAMVDGLGRPQILQAPDTMSAEAEAQRLRLARAQQAGGPESFSAPQEVMQNGQRVLVQFGNRGSVRPVQGYSGTPAETGLNPVWMQDANGNVVPALPTRDGRLVPVPLPPGAQALPPTRDVRLGSTVETITGPGGQTVGTRQIDNQGPARDTARGREVGEQEGAAIANAPREARNAEVLLGQIDGVLNHRALTLGTGFTGRVANAIPGTPTYDFGQRVAQLQGQAFLQAFESLKGGGAITQVEGEKATQAIARLNTAQSAADFRAALNELRDVVVGARDRARARVQQGGSPAQPAPAAPQGGVPIPGAGGAVAEPPPRIRTYNPATGRLE